MFLMFSLLLYIFFKTFYNCIVPVGFISWEIRVAFPGENQLRQSRATQPTVHVRYFRYFRVSIIHRTLTRTTSSLTCTQMLMHAIAHGDVTHVTESAPKVDPGRKIPCRTGESDLRQWRDSLMLYPLSFISPQLVSKVQNTPIG